MNDVTGTGNDRSRIAHHIDDLRIIPRVLIMSAYIFFGYAFMEIVFWFQNYDWSQVKEPMVALAIAGFPTAVLGVLLQVLKAITDTYMKTGHQRNGS